jgi:hypothetical protein
MPGIGLGLGISSVRRLGAPAWMMPDAVFDEDFATDRYYGGGQSWPSMAAEIAGLGGTGGTRASSATFFDKNGVLQTAAPDEMRRDHDPLTLEPLGFLVEGEARTRLNTVALAPVAAQNVTVAAVAHTISFYGTGSIALSGANVQSIASAGAYPRRQTVTFTPTAGTLTIAPSGDIRDLQLEAGAYASSVIRGEGSQITRAADIAFSILYVQSGEHTLYAEARPLGNGAALGNAGILSLEMDGSNRSQIRSNVSQPGSIVLVGGVTEANGNFGGSGSWATFQKVVIAVGLNDFKFFTDGVQRGVTDVAVAAFPTSAIFRIGGGAAVQTFMGHIKRIAVFPRKLSAAEVAAL